MTTPHHRIAQGFVEARRSASALAAFPGAVPATLAQAYAVQALGIALWPDAVAGWKVARIAPALAASVGADRYVGPIFADTIFAATAATPFPIVAGGAGVLEAEIVLVLGADVPDRATPWTARTARDLVAAAHTGIEMAGSPLAALSASGPIASVCGFGNNTGLILGEALPEWRTLDGDIACVAAIDGAIVGQGTVTADLAAPLDALAFALNHAARVGIRPTAGQIVSTGAITGVHPFAIGQTGTATFGPHGTIRCVGEQAVPLSPPAHSVPPASRRRD